MLSRSPSLLLALKPVFVGCVTDAFPCCLFTYYVEGVKLINAQEQQLQVGVSFDSVGLYRARRSL